MIGANYYVEYMLANHRVLEHGHLFPHESVRVCLQVCAINSDMTNILF